MCIYKKTKKLYNVVEEIFMEDYKLYKNSKRVVLEYKRKEVFRYTGDELYIKKPLTIKEGLRLYRKYKKTIKV